MDGAPPAGPKRKPAIGIVADVNIVGKHVSHTVGQKYLDAVTGGAHAQALILPALIDRPGSAWTDPADVDGALDRLDGLLFTGAVSNVAPHHYGATLEDPDLPADPARDHVTLPLIAAAVARGMPVLGICRGCQEINVALGGTLHQAVHRVAGYADHREPAGSLDEQYGPAHDVTFVPGGMLNSLSGMPGARVNSLHGQGAERLAASLVAEATAPDGLVEAFSAANRAQFLLGLQWHPEWDFRSNPLSVIIFRSFGEAARAYQDAVRHARPTAHAGPAP